MSEHVAYDPALFTLERAEVVSAMLGELILGLSRLGEEASAWVPIEAATFTLSAGYSPDDHGTLLPDSETASVSLSFWDGAGDSPLYPSDRVRASYAGQVLFLGTVDSLSVQYATSPEAARYGATRHVTIAANLVGTYAVALAKEVCFRELPAESAITRIRRWITVTNWED
jgi:hypothetical protein